MGLRGARGRVRARLAALSAMCFLALVSIPIGAAPAPAQEPFEMTKQDYVVETRHGQIYVEVVHPAEGEEIVDGPAIFTYSPYSLLGLPPDYRRNNDADRWVPRGYHRVWADVVGTGNSGGCYDYGGTREKETGHDLVEWIAAQDWSTGKVGMIGGSYEGTTATATATQDPDHLTTIVPEAAISRWYEYAYSGGIRYFLNNEEPTDEGVDTPLAFDFGLAIPPPVDIEDEGWAERVEDAVTPCDEIEHTEHGYNDTPDYGEFWLERDYIVDAANIDIPVLVSHNWGDWNVKQEEAVKLYRALGNAPAKKLYMGTRWEGHGTPGGDYDSVVDDWMDHYLMGADNEIPNLAAVTSQMSNREGPAGWYAGAWPQTTRIELFAQEDRDAGGYKWKLLPSRPRAGKKASVAQFRSTGTNTEAVANTNPRANGQWFWFETPPLKRNLRIFGNPVVKLRSTVQRRWITFTPTIVDFEPSTPNPHGPVSATRGWLDSRYRKTLSQRSDVEPGRPFGMTVVEKPQDYTFKKGHRIGLNVQTEISEWSIPKLYPGCESSECMSVRLHWERGGTRLILPVVGSHPNPSVLFESPGRPRENDPRNGPGNEEPGDKGDKKGGKNDKRRGQRGPTVAGESQSRGADGGGLPFSGSALIPFVATGALLVCAGAVALRTRRRRLT